MCAIKWYHGFYLYEYDSIRFYIKAMEINARFLRVFIVRAMGFRAVTRAALLDSGAINAKVAGKFPVSREKFCRAFPYARNILFFEERRF